MSFYHLQFLENPSSFSETQESFSSSEKVECEKIQDRIFFSFNDDVKQVSQVDGTDDVEELDSIILQPLPQIILSTEEGKSIILFSSSFSQTDEHKSHYSEKERNEESKKKTVAESSKKEEGILYNCRNDDEIENFEKQKSSPYKKVHFPSLLPISSHESSRVSCVRKLIKIKERAYVSDINSFVQKNKILFISSELNEETERLTGEIAVTNDNEVTSVQLRYSYSNWKSFEDEDAKYSYSSPSGLALYRFEVSSPLTHGCSLEIAFCVKCNGTEYWDNNHGQNYSFSFVRREIKRDRRFLNAISQEED